MPSRYEHFLEEAPDAVVIIDHDQTIEYASPPCLLLFGYVLDELIGQPLTTLLPAEFRARHVALAAHFIEFARRRPMGSGLRLYAQRKDGSQFRVDIALAPITSTHGPRYAAAIRDISVQANTEQRLQYSIEANQRAIEFVTQAYNATSDWLAQLERALAALKRSG